MAVREKEIMENPKYSKTQRIKNNESNISTPINDISKDSPSGYGDINKDHNNSSSLNSSVNVSQLNKTARIQNCMSIFQRNFGKIAPIIKMLINMLVKEGEDSSAFSSNTYSSKRKYF